MVDVLINKSSYAGALLYGRRALKGYRKMGSDGITGIESSLRVLVRICHLSGNYDKEDAYAVILSDFAQLKAPDLNSTDATLPNVQPLEPPSSPLNSSTDATQSTAQILELPSPVPKLSTDVTQLNVQG